MTAKSVRIKRRIPRPSTLQVVLRMNEVEDSISRYFEEKLSGPLNEPHRIFLRDALLEGFLLGLLWTLGDKGRLQGVIHQKDNIDHHLFYNRPNFGNS